MLPKEQIAETIAMYQAGQSLQKIAMSTNQIAIQLECSWPTAQRRLQTWAGEQG